MAWQATLGLVDYLVAVIILLVPVGIGVYFAVKDVHHVTRVEYLLGGRRMTSLPVAMSLFVTYQSAITFMGIPAEVYFQGFIYVLGILGRALTYAVGTFMVVPLMYPLKITSVNAYLTLRFESEAVRLLCTVFAMMSIAVNMAITLLSPALALQTSANVPLWLSIVVLGSAGTIYTAIGGIKSVIWTDAFQCGIIVIGLVIILGKSIADVGGIGEVWTVSSAGGRLKLDEFSLDPRVRHTVWGMILGQSAVWGTTLFNQATLQRISSMKSLSEAKWAYALAGVLLVISTVVLCFMGLVIFAYFSVEGCDPKQAGYIFNQNQIAPYFVLHTMAEMPGMAGLFISVLCCGSLSTLSSGLNALAAVTVEDVLRRPFKTLHDKIVTNITKIIVVVYGGLVIGLTYLMKSYQGNLNQLTATVVTSLVSPTLGIFLMGASFPSVNKCGVLAGAVVSFFFNVWINIGSQMHAKRPAFLPPIESTNCLNDPQFTNTSAIIPATVLPLVNMTNTSAIIPTTVLPLVNTTSVYISEADDDFSMYHISYTWFTLMSATVCILVGLIVSLITNKLSSLKACGVLAGGKTSDGRLIFPCLRKVWGLHEPPSGAGHYTVVNSNDVIEHTLPHLDESKL